MTKQIGYPGPKEDTVIKILGYFYYVDQSKTEDEIKALGRFIAKTQTIQLASDLSAQQAESTLLHEILEALGYHLGIEIEHKQMMALESGLYQTLKDNGVDLSVITEGNRHGN